MDWKTWGIEKIADLLLEKFLKIFKVKECNNNDKLSQKPIRDVIRNEEGNNSVLIKSKIQDFNTKAVLFVMPGEEAVFINNGKITGILEEGRYVLDTSNIPFFSEFAALISRGKSIYCSGIYYLRVSVSQPLDWGTSLQVRDPINLISTRVMCRGTYRIQIKDSVKFVRDFVGNGKERLEYKELAEMLQNEIVHYIKAYLTTYMIETREELLGICSNQEHLSQKIHENIKFKYIQYGFEIVSFFITGMDLFTDSNRKKVEYAYANKRIREIQ